MHNNINVVNNKNSSKEILNADSKLIVEESDEIEDASTDTERTLKDFYIPKLRSSKWPKKFSEWVIPWFLISMCGWQLFFFFIGNECIYERLILTPEHHGNELWRYITYTLLHSDLIHLVLNVCLQCMIGLILECEQGHWRVAFIYVMGGVSGSLATTFLQPQLSLLGASAAIYALLMSHIPHLIKNFPHLPHRFLRIVALIVLCVSDFAFTLFHFLVNHNLNPRICLEAHMAGGITGLCLGLLVFKRLAANREQ